MIEKTHPLNKLTLVNRLGLNDSKEKTKANNYMEVSFSISWYSDKERKNKIYNAVLGDTRYYTISCNGIPNNTILKLNLYDTNQPLGNTNLKKYQSVTVRNRLIENSIFFDMYYFDYIKKDTGNEIEIYWKTIYNGAEYDIFNAILNLQDDEYYRAIVGSPNTIGKKAINQKYTYTCNCGWIDKSHFDTTTKRPRIDIGATNLWKQIQNEIGEKSVWKNGFRVIYTQDASIKGITEVGVTNEYFIKYGLPIKTREQIALTIFQEVSLEFEKLQKLNFLSGSSFEPADLVSDLLGFYTVIRPKLTPEFILKDLCKEMSV